MVGNTTAMGPLVDVVAIVVGLVVVSACTEVGLPLRSLLEVELEAAVVVVLPTIR